MKILLRAERKSIRIPMTGDTKTAMTGTDGITMEDAILLDQTVREEQETEIQFVVKQNILIVISAMNMCAR